MSLYMTNSFIITIMPLNLSQNIVIFPILLQSSIYFWTEEKCYILYNIHTENEEPILIKTFVLSKVLP